MSGTSANVRSVEALRTVKAALLGFEEDILAAFAMLEQEIRRTIEWLEHDRPQYWRQQIRRGFDQVAEARKNLQACRMREVAGNRPACIEEQVAYRNAKQRLQNAQDKVEIVRRWSVKVSQEFDEYRGRTGHLQTFLDGQLPMAVASLQRMIDALELYAGRAPSDLEGEATVTPPPAHLNPTDDHKIS